MLINAMTATNDPELTQDLYYPKGVKAILIQGGTKIQRQAINHIVPWVLSHLVGKRIAKNIELSFKIKKNLKKNEGIEGTTQWEDDNHKPRDFLIELDGSQNTENFILTMCHELVHVKQYALGEMKDIFKGPNNLLWRGQKINTHKYSVNYWEQPWEIEAFGREQGLYIMWKEANRVAQNKTFEKFLKSLPHTH